MAKRTGRPTDYTPQLADEICKRVTDESLKKVCEADDMPGRSTVYQWLAEYPEFADKYARACEERAENMAQDIVDIADNEPDANRARVRIDARKWVASKLLPKKYGEKLDMNVSGTIGLTDDQLETRIAQLLGKAGTGEAT